MKTITMVIAVVAYASTSFAQEKNTSEKLIFGVKAGVNYSNIYDTEGEDFQADGKLGLAGGAFLSIPIGEFLGIQPELLISQKGFAADGTILGTPYRFKRTTTHIDLPIFFVVKPARFLSVMAGPQYSYMVHRKDKFSSGSINLIQEQEFNNEDLRNNTLAFVLGADINYNHLVIGGRVGWDVVKNRKKSDSVVPRYRNTWIQATIGYRFYRETDES
ncbi:MAG: porin family protein [Salibacteraceae bacterium]